MDSQTEILRRIELEFRIGVARRIGHGIVAARKDVSQTGALWESLAVLADLVPPRTALIARLSAEIQMFLEAERISEGFGEEFAVKIYQRWNRSYPVAAAR